MMGAAAVAYVCVGIGEREGMRTRGICRFIELVYMPGFILGGYCGRGDKGCATVISAGFD